MFEINKLKEQTTNKDNLITNYNILKQKVNEFFEFKELDSTIIHTLISRIEIGYRDEPRTIKIYYKFINETLPK